jgi:menaquinone-9 beta-reductase
MITSLDDLRGRYDLVIVGARPAGAGTALVLARHGARVLVIDRGRYGTDTLSTHALMRGGVLQLARWGVLPAIAASTPPVRRATFLYGGAPLPVNVKPRNGVDALYAPRRTVLDRALVDAAVAAGADVAYGTRALTLTRHAGGRVNGLVVAAEDGNERAVAADWVIGADGTRSDVARFVDSPVVRDGESAASTVFGYWAGFPVDGYRWYYETGLAAGAIPTNDGLTCVFVAVPASRFGELFKGNVAAGYGRVLAAVGGDLVEGTLRGTLEGSLHGFPGRRGFYRRSAGPGWALVGDAGYFKDPITAHGITDALIEAEYLARALHAGTDLAVAEYEATRDERTRGMFELTDRIASFDWTLDEVRALHKALADEISREAQAIVGLELQEATA